MLYKHTNEVNPPKTFLHRELQHLKEKVTVMIRMEDDYFNGLMALLRIQAVSIIALTWFNRAIMEYFCTRDVCLKAQNT